jgi:alpha-ketoglutarate-dependent 2,4-dichlorophenoxyacetate dioxygenase
MGSYATESPFKTIKVKEVHPTFAAEVEGVDWKNLSDEQFNEVFAAMAKVSSASHHIHHNLKLVHTP